MSEPMPDYGLEEDMDYDLYYTPEEWSKITTSMGDSVESPSHYNSGKIECIDYLKDNMPFDNYLGYLEGNTKKYLHRWRYKKKPLEDLKKAQWYLNRLVKELEDGA
jgi:hypothetical protein